MVKFEDIAAVYVDFLLLLQLGWLPNISDSITYLLDLTSPEGGREGGRGKRGRAAIHSLFM